MADKATGWMARAKQAAKNILIGVEEIEQTREIDFGGFGYDGISTSVLLGSGKKPARSRVQILQKWHYMMGDPIISTALRLHVTMALGGHETSGDVVFLEPKPDMDAQRTKLAEEIAADLGPVLNRVAFTLAFNGAGYGDAYARVYCREKVGVLDLYVDEMVNPALVQPYERGNRTVGYVVTVGSKFVERLTVKQLSRMKMPRLLYTPQTRVIEKAQRMALSEDDLDNLPILPSLVGGSFLESAEEAFDNLTTALNGLVGQRILSSIDESVISANMDGMTLEQRKEFKKSLVDMLTKSKQRADEAIKNNQPVTSRTFHLMPTFGDKQLAQVMQFQGTSGSQSYSVEDVMFHAKLLSGALGIDLAMLGFSDILSGGLGEGGFFRVSAQAAERSRIIRNGLTQFIHEIVDQHTLAKYGWVFDEKDRPYSVNFYGSISALENEKAASGERAMNATALLIQTMTQIRDLGLDEKAVELLFAKQMKMDEDMAKELAKALKNAKPPAPDDGGGFGGGGGGFGGGGKEPPADFDDPQGGDPTDGDEV